MSFPGGLPTGGAGNGADPNEANIKMIQSAMESCFAKSAMSGVAGFGLGGIFGLFMASMAYDTPYHTAGATAPAAAATAGKSVAGAATTTAARTTAAAAALATASAPAQAAPATAPAHVAAPSASAVLHPEAVANLPLRQQLAHGFRDMGSRSWSTAKNFGTVGALFAGIECGIEGLRAKNDMGNGVAAGCLTGAILARNGGPQAAAIGCAGFAAFSAAIDAYLRMPPRDD